jgi:aromatic ring-cleaving dioxygenase
VAKIVEVGLKTTVCFAEMDEASNKQHRIRMQIANTDFIIIAEPFQEWMYRNTKSMGEVFFKNNNFTSFGIWEWLQIGCTSSHKFLGMKHTHPH